MKTLYLHIGTTKTATTSIQRFLEENKDVLQKYGYCFPDSLHVYPRANKRRNAHFLVAKVWDADGSRNQSTIVVGMTGENDKTYHYYAAQFSKNQDGKYKYKNAISLNDIGWQLRLGKLNTGYIIVCNNENVSTIQAVISPRNGSDITKNIEINNIPFVYYLDMSSIPSDYDIQYKFLNENGEEIQ